MAGCPWCSKSLPGAEVPACGSCFTIPHPKAADFEKAAKDEETPVRSISYLRSGEVVKPRTAGEVLTEMKRAPQPLSTAEGIVRRLKIKSNSMREQAYVFNNVVMKFDGEGIATFPEHELEQIKTLMKYRPNRFQLLDEEVPVVPTQLFANELERTRNALIAMGAFNAADEEIADDFESSDIFPTTEEVADLEAFIKASEAEALGEDLLEAEEDVVVPVVEEEAPVVEEPTKDELVAGPVKKAAKKKKRRKKKTPKVAPVKPGIERIEGYDGESTTSNR